MAPRKRKKKPLYKQSAKKLALANRRALQKMESEEEHKWIDESESSVRLLCFPESNTQSVVCLNSIEPLNVDATSTSTETMINSANRRQGAEVYISGIYLNMQFYWPGALTPTQFYPPFATINWVVVRQKVNQGGVTANLPDAQEALLTDVFVNPLADESTTLPGSNPTFSTITAPLGNLVFQNMNNGKNYHILDRGSFIMAAPTQVNGVEATFTWHPEPNPPSDLQYNPMGTFKIPGSTVATPHQFSGNACRTVKVRIHPKCKTRYFQVENNEGLLQQNVRPIKNGVYLMYWTDSVGLSSRWPAPPGGTYVGPQLTANWRTRFKDC